MLLSNFGEAEAGKPIAYNLFTVNIQWGSANAAAFELRPAHSSANPFNNQGPLQLGDGGDDDDNRSAKGTLGVDRFALGWKLDPQLVEFIEDLKKVFRAPRQAVAAPDENDVEPVAVRVPE
jgi:hypothetical protein